MIFATGIIAALVGFLLGVKFAPHIYLAHAEYMGRNEPPVESLGREKGA